MKRLFRSRFRFIAIPALAVTFVFLIGYIIMLLWNFSIANVFSGVHNINLWQAMALFILSKILLGFGKGGRHGGPPWSKRSMRNKFEKMAEDDQEKMSAFMHKRWCDWRDLRDDKSGEN